MTIAVCLLLLSCGCFTAVGARQAPLGSMILLFRYIYFFSIAACCCSVFFAPVQAQVVFSKVLAQKGVADLRRYNLTDEPIELNGEWKMYPGVLLTPDSNFEKHQAYYVDFPRLFNETNIHGEPMPVYGCATYVLKVMLPDGLKPSELALDVPDAYSASLLFVDRVKFYYNGSPGTSAATTIPHYRPDAKRLNVKNSTFTLTLQVANFHHRRGGPYRPLLIGNNNWLKSRREQSRQFDLFLTGCLLMGGLFYLGLFIFGKQDKSILYFALFSLAYTYRIIGFGEYTFHHLFTNLSWFVTLKLEYLSLFVSIWFVTLYNRSLYPNDYPRWAARFFIYISAACTAVTLVSPTTLYTHLVTPFLLLMGVKIFFTFWVYVQAVRNKRIGAWFSFCSALVIFFVFSLVILRYFALINISELVLLFGYVLFFFLHSLVLSYRYALRLNLIIRDAQVSLKAKSDFLSTMSHEIRTPLNAVIGITNVMLHKPQGNEEKKLLDTLLLSANNLLFIINDILDFSKIESGKINIRFAPVNFEQMARQLVDEANDWVGDKPVKLLLHTNEGVNQFVQSDPERMRQVLLNLLSNAVKFTLRGKVELQIKKQFETEDSLTLEFSVTDTGIGIPEEKRQIIFDKFTQVDTSIKRGYGGTGLGLAICREILALQQIELHLESTEGVGSRFWFVQTFQKDKQKEWGSAFDEQQFSAASFAGFFAGKTVLVAEDNAINMMVVEKVLTNQAPEIKLLKAFNGKSAVTLFMAHQPDLVLMDVQMPLVNGLDACRQMRAYEQKHGLPRTAVLALTASTQDEEQQLCVEAGMDAVLSKPFKQEDLRTQMMRLLLVK